MYVVVAVRVDGTLPPERRNQRSPEESRAPHDLTEGVIVITRGMVRYYTGSRLHRAVTNSTGEAVQAEKATTDDIYQLILSISNVSNLETRKPADRQGKLTARYIDETVRNALEGD